MFSRRLSQIYQGYANLVMLHLNFIHFFLFSLFFQPTVLIFIFPCLTLDSLELNDAQGESGSLGIRMGLEGVGDSV